MDTNYRSQVLGSPYVNEGLGDRIMAKTANAVQGVSAMAGNSIRPEDSTKVHSLWMTCQDKISKLAKDWKEVSGMLKYRNASKMTPKQKRGMSNWDLIASKFVPSDRMASVVNPPKRHDAGFSDKAPATTSTISTMNPASMSSSNSMVAEGIWTRPLSILWALRSNDIDKILGAYQAELKKAYDTFISDAVKLTKSNEISVVKLMNTMRDPSLKEKFKLIRGKLGLTARTKTVQNGAVPPPLPTSPSPTPSTPTGGATPPPLPKTGATPPPLPTTSGSKPAATGGTIDTDPAKATEFVNIINKVVDIMIDTVKADKDESSPFMNKDLPTDWNQPPVTKNAPVAEAGKPDAESPSKAPEAADFEEVPGKFLYNFHGYYRKERSFNIPMQPKTISGDISVGGKPKFIEVMWHNENHKNEIWVKHYDVAAGPDGKSTKSKDSKDVKFFQFMDDEVNPRTPRGQQFTIEKIFQNAQPGHNPFKISEASTMQQLKAKEKELLRALYATTYRKAMEFKAKKPKEEDPTAGTSNVTTPKAGSTSDGKFKWDDKGTLFRIPMIKGKPDPSGTPIKMSPPIELESDEILSLTSAGYAVMFKDAFKKIVQKSDALPSTSPTAKPVAVPAAAKAPTEVPTTPSAVKPPETPKTAPEPKAETPSSPSTQGRPKLKKMSINQIKTSFPKFANKTLEAGKVLWIGGGKAPTAGPTPETADKWVRIAVDEESPKTP